jgi:exodeoxyribonuclease-3
MKLATWNVNSVRSRLNRVLSWIDQHKPDVLCLQEIKTEESGFPQVAFQAKGYSTALCAQKTYNGVAILSKLPLTEVTTGLRDGEDDTQARLVTALINGVRVMNVYMPNGQSVGSDKYQYKLRWMERLRVYLHHHFKPETPLVLCGDYNVAPEDRDVYEPKQWVSEPIFHIDARKALESIRTFGLVDVYRKHHSEGSLYSWWDYRMSAFAKNRGLRIDHIFATAPLAAKCTSSEIDRESRAGAQPSDHAAVVATFKL